ncbi:MAG: tRNA (adenosine(37)-N6)-dimethylallyltransferase MiaA [Bacilli bacterium]|nr:tRNA (adenosine(37)-N6)-dimethylallyltransferase MiaA [Bacilli bacterium]MDD4406853.1 tRNA (adenosine(37)-N6)-dimethylallyltransferase MiaA [Bacilli bacterium]
MIITIVGPTGVGKTKLSIELAKRFNAEIINADSAQIYQEMNIGTAKITDLEGMTHHLLNIKKLNEDYTVYDFQKEGRLIINNILKKGKNIIIVGGSGLYISALLFDYKFNKEDKNKLLNISVNEMFSELLKNNIRVDKNNHQRIIRLYNKHILNKEPINIKAENKILYDTLIIGLTTNRDNLYQRINNRVDNMIKEGLLEEVKFLFNKYPQSKQLRTTIGYKEFINYFNQIQTIEEVIEKIKQNSRRFAKRQYTWFNNKMKVIWFDTNYENFNKTIKQIEKYINN